jgi:hypothetical protein
MRFSFVVLSMLVTATSIRADRATDLARIHVEAMGGRERIASLKALRATGKVITAAGKEVRFTMIAARPNSVRMETVAGGRTLVQGTNGTEPAWEFDTGSWPPKYRGMEERVAKTFVADAEFDDALVAGNTRGYAVDFAGEVESDGKKLLRLLVTHRKQGPCSVLLDPTTFLIVMRVEERATAIGRSVAVVTRYDDFRPVEGVLLPHKITTSVDGRPTQQTQIDRVDANPTISADTFSRPKLPAAAATPR